MAAGLRDVVKVRIKFKALDILREKYPYEMPSELKKPSINVHRYVMDLIIAEHEREVTLLSELQ